MLLYPYLQDRVAFRDAAIGFSCNLLRRFLRDLSALLGFIEHSATLFLGLSINLLHRSAIPVDTSSSARRAHNQMVDT